MALIQNENFRIHFPMLHLKRGYKNNTCTGAGGMWYNQQGWTDICLWLIQLGGRSDVGSIGAALLCGKSVASQ